VQETGYQTMKKQKTADWRRHGDLPSTKVFKESTRCVTALTPLQKCKIRACRTPGTQYVQKNRSETQRIIITELNLGLFDANVSSIVAKQFCSTLALRSSVVASSSCEAASSIPATSASRLSAAAAESSSAKYSFNRPYNQAHIHTVILTADETFKDW